MVRNKWIINLRNKVAEFAMECDSCAAIEGAKMSRFEREELQERLKNAVKYIDDKLFK